MRDTVLIRVLVDQCASLITICTLHTYLSFILGAHSHCFGNGKFWALNMPLPCEHFHLVPQYSFLTSTFDDTKIMKIVSLPSQCEQDFENSVFFRCCRCRSVNTITRFHDTHFSVAVAIMNVY